MVAFNSALACTGIRVKAEDGSIVYARTLEFGQNLESQVLFIPRQYEFTGTTASGKPGLSWMSRYAAMGLNGAGQTILADGVNEHGLAAGIFYMPGFAEYQPLNPGDEDQSLAPWELVTWVLTNFATVDEVRAALPAIKVGAVAFEGWKMVPPLHYAVHDASGNSLVIEYTEGKLHLFDNPIGVITNAPTFDWHMTNLRNYINLSATNAKPVALDGVELAEFGQGSGLRGLPGDFTPPSRFVRAVALSHAAVAGRTGADAVLEAFPILVSFDSPRGAVRRAPG
jgi:choloylglycine hydrolase